MSLVNNSANNFKDFLDAIKPYLNYQFYDMSGQGVEANNFSTDEKVIGTWIDGKPLYQKTINCGALPNTSTKYVSSGLTNVNVKDIFGYAASSSYTQPINKPAVVVDYVVYSFETYYNNSNNTITISTGIDRSEYTGYVTLRYTKTTDTAVASGEKIVGQWIDGKPVYEKTIDCGALPNATAKYIDTNITNLDYVISLYGTAADINGSTMPLPNPTGESTYGVFVFKTSDNKIRITTGTDRTGYSGYVIIRYTKTTD